jgi:hypothetical protein
VLSCLYESSGKNDPSNGEMVFSSQVSATPTVSGTVFDITQGFDPADPGASGVAGASVTAMVYQSAWGGWAPWPAFLYNDQFNPQITDPNGQFTFFAPPGSYYLEVDGGPGFQSWRSPLIEIGNQPLTLNIPLTPLSPGTDHQIVLDGSGPNLPVLTINPGDTVQWMAKVDPALTLEQQMEQIDNPVLRLLSTGDHDPLLSSLGFDGGMLSPGDHYQHTFTQIGSYTYSDGAGHTGVVNVAHQIFLPITLR